MFRFIKLFFSNIKLNSALMDAGYNPEIFFDDLGYTPISTLVAYRKINQYEAAIALISALDETLQTEQADNTLKHWSAMGYINPLHVEFAIKLRLYRIFKEKGGFHGSFQDFCKQNPGFGDN